MFFWFWFSEENPCDDSGELRNEQKTENLKDSALCFPYPGNPRLKNTNKIFLSCFGYRQPVIFAQILPAGQ